MEREELTLKYFAITLLIAIAGSTAAGLFAGFGTMRLVMFVAASITIVQLAFVGLIAFWAAIIAQRSADPRERSAMAGVEPRLHHSKQ